MVKTTTKPQHKIGSGKPLYSAFLSKMRSAFMADKTRAFQKLASDELPPVADESPLKALSAKVETKSIPLFKKMLKEDYDAATTAVAAAEEMNVRARARSRGGQRARARAAA